MVLVVWMIFNIWKPRIFILLRGKLSYKSNFLCLLSCWCHAAALAGLRKLRAAGFSASPLSHRFGETKKTKNKSMHGFDWRTRRLGWWGHVCLRSGHCLGAGRLLRGKDERTIMSVNSRALCESRGQRLEPLGGSCCLSISCKVLFPSLSLRLFRSSLSFDGLLSCIHPGPACK